MQAGAHMRSFRCQQGRNQHHGLPPSTSIPTPTRLPTTTLPRHTLILSPRQHASAGHADMGGEPSKGVEPSAEGAAPNLFQSIQGYFQGKGGFDKKRLAELGFGAFSAYGIISNINATILVTIAWITVVKTTGGTPLLEANRARFLAVYAGLWVSSHFLRPFRLSLAIAAAPTMEKVLVSIQSRTGFNKAASFGVLLGCIAVGSITLLACTFLLVGGLSL